MFHVSIFACMLAACTFVTETGVAQERAQYAMVGSPELLFQLINAPDASAALAGLSDQCYFTKEPDVKYGSREEARAEMSRRRAKNLPVPETQVLRCTGFRQGDSGPPGDEKKHKAKQKTKSKKSGADCKTTCGAVPAKGTRQARL